MKAHATTRTIIVPDRQVVIAGDWHKNADWADAAIRAAGRQSSTILHVGDFGLFDGGTFLESVDQSARNAGITMIAVTPGNHEDWGILTQLFAAAPGHAIRVSDVVWVLPPAFVFHAGDRRFMSLGGAASTNFQSLTPGVDWWPEEVITDCDVTRAIRAGWVDVMLTHDAVHHSGIPAVDEVTSRNGHMDLLAADYVRASRDKITRAYLAIGPTLLFHGHLHVTASSDQPGGRRIHSLGRDGDRFGNLVTLDIDTLATMGLAVHAREVAKPIPADAALMWA